MEAVDPRAGQLVTLRQASQLLGQPEGYLTIRKRRFAVHAEHPFPQPVTTVAGLNVYDLQTLIVWDEQRKKRDAERRAAWEANRQTKETE